MVLSRGSGDRWLRNAKGNAKHNQVQTVVHSMILNGNLFRPPPSDDDLQVIRAIDGVYSYLFPR
jgi:hypothetical protein